MRKKHDPQLRSSLPETHRHYLLVLALILTAAFAVRALTANFLRAHLHDAAWFPSGIFAVFDHQAQDWLDGKSSIFRIDDASRTDRATYPPGYAVWLAAIYKISGTRSPETVQKVQWVLDAFSVLLIVGIAVSAFGWRSALWAGGVAALWPLLALYGVTPLPDAPVSWVILGATWTLLLAVKRSSLRWAAACGLLIGASCWLRANAIILPLFIGGAMLLFLKVRWKLRASLAAAVVGAAILVISPVVLRNALAFHAFIPVGLGAGTNLWEGIGETQRGQTEFGAVYGDDNLIEQERVELGASKDALFNLYFPDGVRRDRERARKALAIIVRHPFWYSGVVVRRMASLLKYAGEPNGIYGSAGINVTSSKCLAAENRRGVMAILVTALGMIQSVLRYLLLPLMLTGIVVATRLDARMTALLLAIVVYYLVVGSLMHTQFRYGLPLQALLTVFSGVALWRLQHFLTTRFSLSGKRLQSLRS